MASIPDFVQQLSSRDQLALGAVTSLAAYWLWSKYTASQRAPYPPGPPTRWPLGNILDMPTSRLALGFTPFGAKYGPLTFLQMPGADILVVNSYEVAQDLLEKRGGLYVDRPRLVMMGELVGVERDTPLKHSGPAWRLQRKLLKQALSAEAVRTNYATLLEGNWAGWLKGVAERPESFLKDLSTMMGNTVIEFAWGRRTDDQGNDYLKRLLHIQMLIAKVTFGYVVDLVPFLKHLPTWLPGMKFKRDAAGWKAETDKTRDALITQAIKDIDSLGTSNAHQPAYSTNMLKELRDRGDALAEGNETFEAIKHSGFAFFSAGAETTETTFRAFLLAMALNPSVQAQAHAEIDEVVGREHLPTFDDRDKTPFVRAMLLETLRWSCVAPVGFPHRLTEDDVYNGYFIPKGTTVFANLWGISRNPQYYPNPTTFDPSRFLDSASPAQLDPRQWAFGFGRRICPGNELAMQSVLIGMLMTLWAFEVRLLGGEEGVDPRLYVDEERFTLDNLSGTIPFKCEFIPRFEGAKEKLMQF